VRRRRRTNAVCQSVWRIVRRSKRHSCNGGLTIPRLQTTLYVLPLCISDFLHSMSAYFRALLFLAADVPKNPLPPHTTSFFFAAEAVADAIGAALCCGAIEVFC